MISAMKETLARTALINAQLVYVHGYYWLRVWVAGEGDTTVARDVLCTLRLSAEGAPEGQLADEMSAGLGSKPAQVS